MNKNAKIYICTHTDFECPVKNPVYEIMDSRKLFVNDKSDRSMDGLFWSELMTYDYLERQCYDQLPLYVGFCGYRKYFAFMDDVPNLAALVNKHGAIATTPYKVKGSVYSHYGRCFCFADIDVLKAIMFEEEPSLYNTFEIMLESQYLYTCNMFVMHKRDFFYLMDIIRRLLSTWLLVVGTDIRQRIIDHSEVYLKRNGIMGTVPHQYRIGGNLGERIVSAFIYHYFPDVKTYDIRITENRKPHLLNV